MSYTPPSKLGSSNVIVDIDAERKCKTEKAALFDVGLDEDVWIPLSLIYEYNSENGVVRIPEWFALKKGLI